MKTEINGDKPEGGFHSAKLPRKDKPVEGGESTGSQKEQVPNLGDPRQEKDTTLSSATYSPEREPAQQGLA